MVLQNVSLELLHVCSTCETEDDPAGNLCHDVSVESITGPGGLWEDGGGSQEKEYNRYFHDRLIF